MQPPSPVELENISPLIEHHPELEEKTPYEIFSLFFDDLLVDIMVRNTITYARQKNDQSFTISANEMRQFLGILITSSFNMRCQERNYWEKDEAVACPVIASTISRERFKKIKSCFHLVDNSEINATNREDKMFKLRPLLDHLKKKYMQFDIFHQNLCTDEQMIPYYGNHGSKQFLRNKPIRFGYKVWMLCSNNGYCYNFEIYCGKKDAPDDSDMTVSSKVVIDMASVIEKPQCHRLYFDNLFNSYELLVKLKKRGIQSTGTARENRFRLGNSITKTAELQKMPRGSMDEVTDGHVSFVKWRDNKTVSFASNYVGTTPQGSCKRRVKGQKAKMDIPRPKIADDYNANMGGVDLLDRIIGLYRIQLGSRKWYWPIVKNFIEVSLFNSWRIHQEVGGKLSYLQFIRSVASVLLKQSPRENTVPLGRAAPVTRELRNVGQHWPQTKQPQRRCRYCKKNTTCACETCSVPLHVECFKDYHLM